MTPTTLPPRLVPPSRLRWLQDEVPRWQADGLLDAEAAAALLDRYHASRRLSLGRLLLGLGGAFLGVGLIWLVAANLDDLRPLVRLGLVAALWLLALVAGEALAARLGAASPVTGAVRLLAALGIGAVVFQAAQSLQVPAYEPRLVGLWGLGALLHAYAARSRAPLAVGLPATLAYAVWSPLADESDFVGIVLVLVLAGLAALAAGALHDGRLPAFAAAWRYSGIGLLLVGVFMAAVPEEVYGSLAWTPRMIALVVVTALLVVAAALRGAALARAEVLGGVVATCLAVLLAWWEGGADSARVDAADWGHAALAVTTYAALALAVAVVGVLRDDVAPTALAAIALVLFTTFQSFAVFAQIIQGAWLFVVLGLVLVGTGLLFDRARRVVAAELGGREATS